MKRNWMFTVGKSHLQRGELCQDRASSGTVNDVSYISVSDGIGSKKYSAFGAEYLVNNFVRHIAFNFDKLYNLDNIKIQELIQQKCLHGFIKYHKSLGLDNYDSLKATFSCVVVKDNKVLAINIGDSPIIIIFKDGNSITLEYTDKEFANETTYLPTSVMIKDSGFNIYKSENFNEIQRIICCTDGVADSLINHDNNQLAPALFKDEFFDNLNEYFEFFTTRSHDDCAIAIMENK